MSAFDKHTKADLSLEVQGDRLVQVDTFGGGASTLYDDAILMRVGSAASGAEDYEGSVITSVRYSRANGALAQESVTTSYILKREIWNVEWQEISKDIRTWISSANCPNPVTGVVAAQQLACLEAWESLKEIRDWDNYAAFMYPNTTTGASGDPVTSYTSLPDPVKKVAEKIVKGVQSYSIFAPVVTRTTTRSFMPPASGNLGKIQTPQSESGWSSFNGATMDFSSMATAWLKNVERTSSNGDGTFTCVEGWLGADEIDGDLYMTAGGS